MKICRIFMKKYKLSAAFPLAVSGALILWPMVGGIALAQEEQLSARPPVVVLGSPVAETPEPATLAPPTAPSATVSDSALPDSGTLTPRSPGLELPVNAGLLPGGGDPSAMAIVPEKSPEEIEREIREDAFNAALTGILPLEPEEIRKVLQRYDQTQEASEKPIYDYPEPEVVVKNVSLDPGVRPVEIKVATGHVTTLNVVDISGAPWPIQDVTWAGNFEIVQPEAGGHVVRITPMSEFAYGNISIRMLELKTPITFILKAHRDEVYYRIDARLPEYGPLATPPIIDGGITIAAGNPSMTAVLDGVPPQDARKLIVDGVDGRTTAFNYNGMVYVRTPLTLLSPAWTGSIKSADGMNVYTLTKAPVLLLSDQGRMVRARLTEKGATQ